jgi:beta-aspartyl-dipeptidase (metallo-type)
MLKLLKNARVFAPEDQGCLDVLLAGEIIAHMAPEISPPPELPVETIDLAGSLIVPGFIDQHVHLIGGGGEAGFSTRTPEVTLSNITRWGITTVVGCLGTDGITRHMTSLLAKARGLEAEGITTYIYSGSYEIPTPTITGSIRSDIVIIDKVVGAGEIAVSDHRSAQPTVQQLKALAAEARVGGMLSAKAGVLHLHLGDGEAGLNPLFEIVNTTEIPVSQLRPTHLNRNPILFRQALEWGKQGGFIDITSGVSPAAGMQKAIKPSVAIKEALTAGIPIEQITMSSDGNGSMPVFDEQGNVQALMVASLESLYLEFKDAVLTEGLPLTTALKVITSNPAQALNLYPHKGSVQKGSAADLVVLDQDLQIRQVWARGKLVVENGNYLVKGTFE